jgi:hypothetical protein
MRTTRSDLVFYPDLIPMHGFEYCGGDGIPIPAGVSVKVLDTRNGRILVRYSNLRGFTGHAWVNPGDLMPVGEKYVKPRVTRQTRVRDETPAVSRPHVARTRLSIQIK